MSDQVVLLDSYSSPVEAEIVKGRLESQGIKCLTRDGNVFPHLPLFSGEQGIRLYVLESDLELAREILSDKK